MKRRDLLERVGVASIATIGAVGTASAGSGPAVDLDHEIDVADVSGTVTLASILPADVPVPAGVDPSGVELTVSADAETITPSHCCCCGCNVECASACHDGCCFC